MTPCSSASRTRQRTTLLQTRLLSSSNRRYVGHRFGDIWIVLPVPLDELCLRDR